MSDREPITKMNRRSFLGKVLGGVGGGLALAVSGKLAAGERPPSEAAASLPESQGYRETDHIRAYYETARF